MHYIFLRVKMLESSVSIGEKANRPPQTDLQKTIDNLRFLLYNRRIKQKG